MVPKQHRRSLAYIAVLVCAGLLLTWLPTFTSAQDPFQAMVQDDFTFAAQQLNSDLTAITSVTSYPSTTKPDGTWNTTSAASWTSGFFPGALWLMYQHTGVTTWRDAGIQRQAGIEGQKTNGENHDVGFKIFNSFGNGYRLTGNDTYRQIVLTGAETLATRYSPIVGSIRSSGSLTSSDFEVIIDNMMNLEILLWASKHGGKPEWYNMAVSHALKTRANHIRADGSTYQVVIYDQATGAVKSKTTHQGYNTESTWSRGQAWALYGFTMVYRETKDDPNLAASTKQAFLDTARNTADYFINHLPSDKVPYWDFELPSLTGQPRDSSAAAIAASGLLELSQLETDATRKQTYLDNAKAILTSLSSTSYLAKETNYRSILLHGTRNNRDTSATDSHDTGLIYGDYYFIEALLRAPTQPLPTGTVLGRVTDRQTGLPIAGATIVSSHGTVTTAADGSYSIIGIAAGNQAITVSAPGHEQATQTVTVPENGSVTVDFALNPVTGAPIKAITFEGGSLTGPSGADSVSGTGAALATDGQIKGNYTAYIKGVGYLQQGFTGVDDLYVSFYLKLPQLAATPGSSARIARIANAGTTVGNLVLNTDWTLQLRNGSTSIGSRSSALTRGTIYRVGLHQKKGSGSNAVLEAFLAQGDAAFPATPFAKLSSGSWATQANQFQFGATNGNAIDANFDDIKLDAATMPAPSGGMPPPSDTQPPTIPAGLIATALSASEIKLTWSAATDNIGVAGYRVYRNGNITPIAMVTSGTSYTNGGLASATTYSYTVAAYDAAGNQSAQSSPAIATTLATPPPTSQPIKAITFEGGSLTGPSGADSVSGTGVKLATGGQIKGNYAAWFDNTSSGYLTEDFTRVDNLFVSLYLKVNRWPTTDARIVLISNAGTTIGNIVLRSTGKLRLRIGSTALGAETAPLAVGTVYRVGLHQKRGSSGNAVLEAFLVQGDTAFGAPFAAISTGTWTTQADRLRFGATNGNVIDVTFDDIRLDGATMPSTS